MVWIAGIYMNNDGRDDLVMGGGSSGVGCYVYDIENNDWDAASSGLPTSGAYYPQFGDITGDGCFDIVAYAGPTGYVYVGDGDGHWVLDGTFSMPSPGYFSAFLVDGDFDHDGREDVVIQAEQGSWPSYQNILKAFSPWVAPSVLSALVQSPHGGEILRSGSIRNIRWLSAVPASQGEALVDIFLSHHGAAGPWEPIATDIPNNGWYQWLISASGSEYCRIKVVVTTSESSASAISGSDFTILGFAVDAHGPYYGAPEQVIQFTGTAENGTLPYDFCWDFGDGTSSSVQNPTHSYAKEGNYTVVLSVTDADDLTITDTTWALISEMNTPPYTPDIQGPARGNPHVSYDFTVVTTDPDLDTVSYYIDWGDTTSSDWFGPFASGEEETVSHLWNEKGTYSVKVKAKDSKGAESDWGILSLKIPFSYDGPVLIFLEWLVEQFPHAFPILRYLLNCS
ncbi:MAG: PKD domain-containing protein [Candidatus Thermoplasmatota archaeon]